jgi:hypothetical protein
MRLWRTPGLLMVYDVPYKADEHLSRGGQAAALDRVVQAEGVSRAVLIR